MKSQLTFVYDPDGLELSGLELVGSWDDQGQYSQKWSSQPFKKSRDGLFRAKVKLEGERHSQFWWGVKREGEWALFEEEPLTFHLDARRQTETYHITTLNRMGLHRLGSDLKARCWAPHAQTVDLCFPRVDRRYPLEFEDGFWHGRVKAGWKSYQGEPYGYLLTTAEGHEILRPDPYARTFQGPQRGVDDLFLEKRTAQILHRYQEGGVRFLRFEAITSEGPVRLAFWKDGKRLKKAALQKRLGAQGGALVRRAGEAFWQDQVNRDGTIDLRAEGDHCWSVVVNRPEKLQGVEYELLDAAGQPHHDPHRRRLEGLHVWPGLSLLTDTSFAWKHQDTPRKAVRPEQMMIYQLHVGSWMGRNGNRLRSSFKDLLENLDYIVELGANTIELLPTNTFEGHRDWGYIGTNSLGVTENYGFFEKGRWVSGAEALKRFVDAAHARGLSVINDVVYNHLGGEHNTLWEFDGLKNSWFEWEENPEVGDGPHPSPWPRKTSPSESRCLKPSVRQTPWGPIPAFNKKPVAQFFIDHAVCQVREFGFDGIRFDFTHLIHSSDGGGQAGWKMLRRMHRILRTFYPKVLTFAEEFPQHTIITEPVGGHFQGGAGFNGMWNTEFQHRLVFHHHSSSLLERAAREQTLDFAPFLNHVLMPEGFNSHLQSVTVLSNHDEVGNGCRLLQVASQNKRLDSFRLGLCKLVTGLALLSPGIPILFQGTEFLARNFFSWGLPQTWDLDWSWRHSSQGYQYRHFEFVKKVLELRRRASDLWALTPFEPVRIRPDEKFMLLRRGRFLLLANFGRGSRSLFYKGEWHLELDSHGKANQKSRGGFEMPPASLLVYSGRPRS